MAVVHRAAAFYVDRTTRGSVNRDGAVWRYMKAVVYVHLTDGIRSRGIEVIWIGITVSRIEIVVACKIGWIVIDRGSNRVIVRERRPAVILDLVILLWVAYQCLSLVSIYTYFVVIRLRKRVH